MPREKINDHVSQGWYTEVSWRRRPGVDPDDQGTSPGHVQLATVNALSPFHFPDVETEGHFEAGDKFDGWRVTLDEAGIDHLIKVLHKAKRQAYGGPGYASGGIVGPATTTADGVPVVLSSGGCYFPSAIARGVAPDSSEAD